MVKAFDSFCGFVRFALMVIIVIFIFRAIMVVHKRFDSAIPRYTTKHFHKPQYRADPDTVIKWLERIVQGKVEPVVVYDTVFYDSEWEHLIRTIRSNGKTIQVQTQLCGTPMGQDHIYPYMRRYQIVPTPTGLDVIHYRDYFRWMGLLGVVRWGLNDRHNDLGWEIKSGIEYVPWRLEGQIYITTNGGAGIELEKRFW